MGRACPEPGSFGKCGRALRDTSDPRLWICPKHGPVRLDGASSAGSGDKPPEPDVGYIGGLFDAPLVRSDDVASSHKAADKVRPHVGGIQAKVIEAYRTHGAMTFTTAEQLPEFQHYKRSTIQKRVSELSQMGILELVPGAENALYRLNEARIDDPLEPERCPTCQRVWRNR